MTTNKNSNVYILNGAELQGFFEGDGGIEVRVSALKNSISYRPLFKFSQTEKHRQILEWVQQSIAPDVNITADPLNDATALVFPFDSPSGQRFIDLYLKNKPLNPGTLKDFLIALLIHQYNKTGVLPLSIKSLSNLQTQTKEKRERMESFMLLWLRFQRPAQRILKSKKKSKKGLSHPIDYYFNQLNATSFEILEAEKYGKELLAPILIEVNQLVSNLNNDKIQIPADYITYYHVADGCLTFAVGITKRVKKATNIKVLPSWTIADDLMARPLLKRIQRQLGMTSYQGGKNDGFCRANGWDQANNVVIPFFTNKTLPEYRENQFKTFVEVCELHSDLKMISKDETLFREYVFKAYFMNIDSCDRRSEAKFEQKFEEILNNLFNPPC